jgi:DNA-binding NtrC family response regulator
VERVDVRIIAATSRDLAAMVGAGTFRADLYYRLNVLPIRLPALRERLADLEALVESLSEDIARRSGLPARSVSPEALALLARRAWPGNIRELRNVLEQAALMTDDLVLEPGHFSGAEAAEVAGQASRPVAAEGGAAGPKAPPRTGAEAADVPAAPAEAAPQAPAVLRPLSEQVAEVERAAIAAALKASGGNRVQAARTLGMSRAALYDRLERWPELAGPE